MNQPNTPPWLEIDDVAADGPPVVSLDEGERMGWIAKTIAVPRAANVESFQGRAVMGVVHPTLGGDLRFQRHAAAGLVPVSRARNG